MENKYLIAEIEDHEAGNSSSNNSNSNDYQIRRASRAILIKENMIAMLFVEKNNYHKLPGGGFEDGEDQEEALKREVLEETGWNIEIKKYLGITLEYRNQYKMLQISYIFEALSTGVPGKLNFTEKEISKGFKLVWISLADIMRIINHEEPEDYTDKFIHTRDKKILDFYFNYYLPSR